jgi:hypothetical protein
MRTKVSIEELLRWRLTAAEIDAPPRPHAAELLAWARPWWEKYPDRFQTVLHSLMTLQRPIGDPIAQTGQPSLPQPVPALIVRVDEQIQACVGLQYLKLRDGRLHFRFYLVACANPVEESYEVTFVSSLSAQPLFFAEARRWAETEYRLDTEVPLDLTEPWGSLRATDPVPFRLILRPEPTERSGWFGGGGARNTFA